VNVLLSVGGGPGNPVGVAIQQLTLAYHPPPRSDRLGGSEE
jgi:hypothetical protein